MVRRGIFPPGVVVRFHRQIRFDEAALERWIAAGGTDNRANDENPREGLIKW